LSSKVKVTRSNRVGARHFGASWPAKTCSSCTFSGSKAQSLPRPPLFGVLPGTKCNAALKIHLIVYAGRVEGGYRFVVPWAGAGLDPLYGAGARCGARQWPPPN
jgi:hypothetical protein